MLFPVIRWLIVGVFAWSIPASHAQIRISEVFADNRTNAFTDGSVSDWVELYNSSGQAVSLEGYSLTDAASTPRKWIFPANITIQPNNYLTVLLDSSRPASSVASGILNAGFAIKAGGDRIELYSPASVLVESVRFGSQAANYTIGRVPSGSGDFTLTSPTPGGPNVQQLLGSQAALRINEWMASPSSGEDWFELYNPDTLPVQLTGLHFTDSNNEPSPVAPLSYIGNGLNGFLQIFADNSTNDNEVDFGLGGGGDSTSLHRADGSVIDSIAFGQQTSGISQGKLPDGSGAILNLNLPTPGESNLIRYEGLVVNEVLSHTDPPFEDAVEFYNSTATDINIGGWYLSNSRNNLKRYRVPDGTLVPAGGYRVFYENQFNGSSAATPFGFSSSQGDQVYLSQAISENLTGYIVEENFEAAENAVSFGRVSTSVPGDYKFVALTQPSFGVDNPASVAAFRLGTGMTNAGPRVGPISINEVMYNPLSPDVLIDNTADEYIELVNITGQSVPLFDPAHPENPWRIQGGVAFTFPPNTTMPASSTALLVSFDPADAGTLAAFRSKFSVPQNVPIFGPYVGKLRNSGDEVELYKPDPPEGPDRPDAGFVPYIRVDKVNYSDVAPWPTEPDGTGKSLQRKDSRTFGNDPINWQAANPTPGTAAGNGTENIQVGIVRSGNSNSIQIQFNAVAGSSYSVQYRDGLQDTTGWQHLTSTNATSSVVVVEDQNFIGRQHRFYRVVTPAST